MQQFTIFGFVWSETTDCVLSREKKNIKPYNKVFVKCITKGLSFLLRSVLAVHLDNDACSVTINHHNK